MSDLLVPIGCILLGLVIMALEMFIPSAGVLGVTSALLLIGGVVSSFYYGGLGVGTVFVAATSIATGVMISFLVRWWPHTRLGELILPENTTTEEVLPDRSRLASMVGRVGQARAVMLPGGIVEIEGERFDAIGLRTIEQGTWVEVTGVQGNDLLVKPISVEEARRSAGSSVVPNAEFQDPFEDPLG